MLLIVWHSRTGASQALAEAAKAAAGKLARLIAAEVAGPSDLLDAGGYLFVCPENLGSMSGAMKELFDLCYYPLLGQIEGRPYASIIAAGSDGHGAEPGFISVVSAIAAPAAIIARALAKCIPPKLNVAAGINTPTASEAASTAIPASSVASR